MFSTSLLIIAVTQAIKEVLKMIQEHSNPLAKDELSIAVLGNKGSGKTSLLRALGANVDTGIGTLQRTRYNAFDIITSKKSYSIKSSFDIGGSPSFLESKDEGVYVIEKIIKENDIVIYLIDVNEFIKDGYNPSQEDDLARLWHLVEVSKKCNKKNNLHVFATHNNLFIKNGGIEAVAKSKIEDIVERSSCAELFKNLLFIDTADKESVRKMINKVFK